MAVSLSVEAGIGTITLDRPPANSYDLEYVQELGEALQTAADEVAKLDPKPGDKKPEEKAEEKK